MLFSKAALSQRLVSLEIFLLGYSLLKLLLKIEGLALHWFRNVYRWCWAAFTWHQLHSHIFTIIYSTNNVPSTYYVPGMRANTRDTVSADVVLMVWMGSQTIHKYIHVLGCAVKGQNRVQK